MRKKKKTMGIGTVEKFSYSIAIQEIALSGLIFLNNRKGCGYVYFSSKKEHVKNLNQNLKRDT